jgi:hypothetical protein
MCTAFRYISHRQTQKEILNTIFTLFQFSLFFPNWNTQCYEGVQKAGKFSPKSFLQQRKIWAISTRTIRFISGRANLTTFIQGQQELFCSYTNGYRTLVHVSLVKPFHLDVLCLLQHMAGLAKQM